MTEPVVVRLDIAPAVVTFTPAAGESQTLNKARVIVTDERVYVFVDARPTPTLFFDGRLDSFDGRNTTGWQAVTANGDAVFFRRGGGCACGSQIKSFRPFPQGMVQGTYTQS